MKAYLLLYYFFLILSMINFKKTGQNHEILKKSLLIIEIKWLADLNLLKI